MPVAAKRSKNSASADQASLKPGKKEKIRYGKAPTKTLPNAPPTPTEDAGAVTQTASAAAEPVNPLETSAKPTQKTRYSSHARPVNQHKPKGPKVDTMAPAAPDAAEVADQQTQAGPLGLAGDTSAKKKKKAATTTGDKTRLTDKKKKADAPAGSSGDAPQAPPPQPPAPAPKQ
jgi:peptidyl-prolyl cis-trans isomerase SurA